MSGCQTSIRELVAAWDRGDIVRSVEMGGLGPGYEQCIQILWIELLRDYEGKPLPADKDGWRDWGDETVRRCDASVGGFSGAQVGAAKNLAARMLKIGYDATMDEVRANSGDDRFTMVSRHFPKPPELIAASSLPGGRAR
jgi:hypothetical protein